jgi:hypothetical protein
MDTGEAGKRKADPDTDSDPDHLPPACRIAAMSEFCQHSCDAIEWDFRFFVFSDRYCTACGLHPLLSGCLRQYSRELPEKL